MADDNYEEIENDEDTLAEDIEEVEEDNDEDRGDTFEPTDDDDLGDEPVDEEEEIEKEDEDTESDSDTESDRGDTEPDPVPYGRFSEVVGQREYEREQNEALREQNAELIKLLKQDKEPKEEAPKAYDYDTAEAAHVEAVLEGDTARAKAIRAEIRAAERKEFLQEAAAYKEEALKGAAKEASRIDDETKFIKIIENSAENYEFLNPDAKGYNQAAVNDINDVFEGLVATGKSKAVALQRAIDLIAPQYGEKAKRGLGEAKKKDRKTAAVKKNVSAAKKQPPKMRGKSTRDKTVTEYDVQGMSDRAFKKLSKQELAELRGDKV